MAFDGAGNFIRLYNWVTDAANGVNITAARVDAEDTGFATGLSNCVTRDGQGAPAADITFNGHQILNVSNAQINNAPTQTYHAANKAYVDGQIASQTADLFIVIGDGVNVIPIGVAANWLELDFSGTITQWTVLAAQSGSISIDLWKTNYTNFDAGATHPVAADKISATAPITFSAATKGQSSTLTGWTTGFAAGDVLAFNVASVATCKQVIISLKVTKTS